MQDELNGKRKVEVDLLCDRCGMEPESTIHVLKGCPWAYGIWLLCPLALHTQQMQALNFSDWVKEMGKCLDEEQLELMLVVAWALWSDRNLLLFQDIQNYPVDVVNKAISFFEEYKKEKLKIVQTPAPPHGVYKIHTDAAIFNQQGIGCLLHPALPSLTCPTRSLMPKILCSE